MRWKAVLSVVAGMTIVTSLVAAPSGTVAVGWKGMTLQQALARLNEHGVAVVFSTALVLPEMRVDREPGAESPRGVLNEILEAHGLAVHEGPGGRLVVVRVPDELPFRVHPGPSHPWRAAGGRSHGYELKSSVQRSRQKPDEKGWFDFFRIPVGQYSVVAKGAGVVPQLIDGIVVEEGEVARVDFDLVSASTFLSEIVVTPSHFRILEEQAENRQFLSREEVSQMPHVADDLYRAVKRMPGASGGDVSAQFNVRGGATDEMLVILDGMEIYEPFHLKDFQNIFSTVDAEAIGGVDFLTGRFPGRIR